MTTRCPCGTGETYDECCGRLHIGAASAPTALALMRSRFSAFAVGDAAYLLATWHPSTRPAELDLEPDTRWTRLDILRACEGGLFDSTGIVEFRAHYRADGQRGEVHERSRFGRENGHWSYIRAEPLV